MKKLKLSARIFILTCIYYVIYNTYFGWNLHPQSAAEQLCDEWWHRMVVISFILYILPALEMYENALRKMEQEKNDQKGEFCNPPNITYCKRLFHENFDCETCKWKNK